VNVKAVVLAKGLS